MLGTNLVAFICLSQGLGTLVLGGPIAASDKNVASNWKIPVGYEEMIPVVETLEQRDSLSGRSDESVKFTGESGIHRKRASTTGWMIPDGYQEMTAVTEEELVPHRMRKRADDPSRLDPQKHIDLVFKSMPKEGSASLLAKIKAQPNKDHPIVALDHFKSLLKSHTLFEKPNTINLEFQNNDQVTYAMKAWDWVNKNSADYFFMVVQVPVPGKKELVRTKLHNVTNVEVHNLETKLTAVELPWESLGELDITVGSAQAPGSPNHARDLNKRFTLNPSLPVDVSFGKPGKEISLHHIDTGSEDTIAEGEFDVKCINCYTTGIVELAARFRTEWSKIKEASISVKTKKLAAVMDVEASFALRSAETFRHEIVSFPIGLISVWGIFNFGPKIGIEAYQKYDAKGRVAVGAKLDVKVPESEAIVDFSNLKKSSVSGFKDTTFEWDAAIKDSDAKVQGTAAIITKVGVSIDLLDSGVASDVEFWLPKVEYTIAGGLKTGGWCPNHKDVRGGVNGKVNAGFQVKFIGLEGSGILKDDIPKQNWEPEWGIQSLKVVDFCRPIDPVEFGKKLLYDLSKTRNIPAPPPQKGEHSETEIMRVEFESVWKWTSFGRMESYVLRYENGDFIKRGPKEEFIKNWRGTGRKFRTFNSETQKDEEFEACTNRSEYVRKLKTATILSALHLQGMQSMALTFHPKSSMNKMSVYVRTLTINDIDKIVELENVCFSEEERASIEKFRYRLTVCGELSHGLFTLSKPHPDTPKGVSDFKPKEILVAMISATKTSSPNITEASMKIPRELLTAYGLPAPPKEQDPPAPKTDTAAAPDTEGESSQEATKEAIPPPEGHVESGETICIHSVCVSPSYRNMGYSQILLKDFIARMRDAGLSKRIALICRKEMTGVYTKVLFRYRGNSTVTHGGGNWVDMIYEYSVPPSKAAARRG
ncbi:hypothetical protein H072_7741 [Dactylellina haptotyla CBS 200.50]|uniref:Uncharacterized protein n=1 Tax=Dactylellina haptotyla (strain CBS 200.50) TaxID=1284197 RepID=S8A659_DACHA|nr:hypothetical protein H072_7741 [Dactylellina haptotyla CBS 200.50]